MGKIAVVLIAFSFILTSCGVDKFEWWVSQIVEKTNANYVDYSEELLQNTSGDKVLFFHATWCATCKSASQKISDVETTTWLTVFKIDYDSSSELRKKYDVTSQHTFVQVDQDGNMLAKWGGSKDIEDIKAQLVVPVEAKEITEEIETTVELSDTETEEVINEIQAENDVTVIAEEISVDSEETSDKEIMSDTEEVMIKNPGKYVDYTPAEVAATQGTKVLFFHATWCPNCKASNEGLLSETAPDGLSVFKVDYDTNEDLRKKYGVLTQTTFVQIDDNGDLINKWFGSKSYAEILAQLK